MNYEFRKIYDVATEAGCEISDDMSIAKQTERLQQVKTWINTNFGDIFEALEPRTGSGNSIQLNIYFKGTKEGIYIQLSNSTLSDFNGMGILFNGGSTTQLLRERYIPFLHNNTLKLLVVKSKYGFIAGFFKDTITGMVKTMAINLGDRLMPIIYNTVTDIKIAEGASDCTSSAMMHSNLTKDCCLVRFYPPLINYGPEGAYLNFGNTVNGCSVYGVSKTSDKFADLAVVQNYTGITLKLVEPVEADYANIQPLWDV